MIGNMMGHLNDPNKERPWKIGKILSKHALNIKDLQILLGVLFIPHQKQRTRGPNSKIKLHLQQTNKDHEVHVQDHATMIIIIIRQVEEVKAPKYCLIF